MRRGALLLVFSLIGSPLHAGPSTPPWFPGSCSRIPTRIVLVGQSGGIADATLGTFEVDVCRFSNPSAFASVAVALQNAAGLRLGRGSTPAPRVLNCATLAAVFQADASGRCRITLTGSAFAPELMEGPCVARIYGNGVGFGDVSLVCYDLDGAAGIGINDLSQRLTLLGSGGYYGVADYDGDGALDVNDLSMWIDAFSRGTSTETSPTGCP